MARIRTVKPEFQNSQSMGRISRDARLTFILLWPQCDDAGRIRANSRMLASVLFPYDEDAPRLIDGWLEELEKEDCIVRYIVDRDEYLQICHWAHQKIDHPKASDLPPPPAKNITKSKKLRRDASREIGEDATKARAVSSTVSRNGSDREGIKDREGKDARSAGADEPAPPSPELTALEEFNAVASEFGWPLAQRLTDSRKSKLRQRLAECGGIDGWRAAMAKARASPFLRGESGRDKNHEKWAPDLDFFLQQSSFTKLMEGKYDDRSSSNAPSGFAAVLAGGSEFLAGSSGELPGDGRSVPREVSGTH